MTVEKLFSVERDKNELKSLYMELARLEDFNPYKSCAIKETPRGGTGSNFVEWYAEERDRILGTIAYCEEKIQRDKKEIEDFIKNAPYPECDIIRFRVINNMSWDEIGSEVGYSRRHTAKLFWNYIKNDQNNQEDHEKV